MHIHTFVHGNTATETCESTKYQTTWQTATGTRISTHQPLPQLIFYHNHKKVLGGCSKSRRLNSKRTSEPRCTCWIAVGIGRRSHTRILADKSALDFPVCSIPLSSQLYLFFSKLARKPFCCEAPRTNYTKEKQGRLPYLHEYVLLIYRSGKRDLRKLFSAPKQYHSFSETNHKTFKRPKKP